MSKSSYNQKPYSDRAVEMLLKLVEQGKEYDISIDEQQIVARTNDKEMFFDFMEFLSPTTKFITFRIYKGGSRKYDKITLYMPKNGLNGSPEQEAQEANQPKINIDREKSDWEKDRYIKDLEAEVESLSKKVKTIKKKAEEKIKEIKDSQNTLSGMLETIAPAAIQVLANSKLSQTYPALGMLGNINEPQRTHEPQETSYNPPPVSEVKFSESFESQGLTEKQEKQLRFFKEIEKNFQSFELETIFEFIKRAAKDKQLLEILIPTTQTEDF